MSVEDGLTSMDPNRVRQASGFAAKRVQDFLDGTADALRRTDLTTLLAAQRLWWESFCEDVPSANTASQLPEEMEP